MANTFSALYYHFIFSTKNRIPLIKPQYEHRIWEYIGGIARDNKLLALQVGGVDDHIHAIISASPSVPSSKIAQLMKGGSSFWIRRQFAELRNFEWQDGYGVFTISKSVLPNVERYIQKQREHHRKMSFQDEYIAFLEKCGVKYDERYLWG